MVRLRKITKSVFVVLGLMALCSVSKTIAQEDQVAALTRLDARQKTMVANADVKGLSELAHADLRINAPTNRILTREQFLAMMKSGQIGAEAFDRTVESVSVTGDIGIVMGHEVFTPTAATSWAKHTGSDH